MSTRDKERFHESAETIVELLVIVAIGAGVLFVIL